MSGARFPLVSYVEGYSKHDCSFVDVSSQRLYTQKHISTGTNKGSSLAVLFIEMTVGGEKRNLEFWFRDVCL